MKTYVLLTGLLAVAVLLGGCRTPLAYPPGDANRALSEWKDEFRLKPDGVYVSRYPDGRKRCEGELRGGRIEGCLTVRDPEGNVRIQCEYRRGFPRETLGWTGHGRLTYHSMANEQGIVIREVLWTEERRILSSNECPDGVQECLGKGRRADSVTSPEGEKIIGKFVSWHPNGVRSSETEYGRFGPIHRAAWQESGLLSDECYYRRGVLDGQRTTWHRNGSLRTREMYDDGKPVKDDYWNEKGELVAEGTYRDGERWNGCFTEWKVDATSTSSPMEMLYRYTNGVLILTSPVSE